MAKRPLAPGNQDNLGIKPISSSPGAFSPMVSQHKDAIRKDMLKRRDFLGPSAVSSLSMLISDNLLMDERFQEAKTIGFYLPKGNEVDTSKIIGHALRQGKEVLVPVTDHKITFYRFASFEDLRPGKYGIPEPLAKAEPSKEPDIVVVPGVAFGLCMHRLGYGKGYYDRYLCNSSAFRIGICYDFQVVERLPSHENDERMDRIITEKRIIDL